MSWTLVRASLPERPADWSLFIDAFARHGCETTLEEDAPPALTGCVVALPGSEPILAALSADLRSLGAEVTTEPYVEQDWDQLWRQHFQPRRVGNNLVVTPTWIVPETRSGDIVLRLDPGQAFGTGEHPTTRMCLAQLEAAGCADRTVLDLGSGSGILSIAAAKLGAARVVATDVDPIAVEVARANFRDNDVAVETACGEGWSAVPAGPYDVVLSNIISATLIRLAPGVAERIAKGGAWIVSGIIEDNWADVQRTANRCGFDLEREEKEDGWVAATFRR